MSTPTKRSKESKGEEGQQESKKAREDSVEGLAVDVHAGRGNNNEETKCLVTIVEKAQRAVGEKFGSMRKDDEGFDTSMYTCSYKQSQSRYITLTSELPDLTVLQSDCV